MKDLIKETHKLLIRDLKEIIKEEHNKVDKAPNKFFSNFDERFSNNLKKTEEFISDLNDSIQNTKK